ncbi:UvrD-helicase domain-containing protein [Actinoplanes sp. DH11]|uniref:UvrD-helicase domain-containing protein n=1 Tax=Actinoplanes sp. DH11 TaxID=2857011 RepID=UPI001E6286A1|nr:ATP-dependent helicase [Actinoplanes sp. DH11]
MIVPSGLNRRLAAELAELNESQLAAVLHPGSQVVRAGPGSGKTRTLVAKAAYALDAVLPPRRGLAAITYTRHAAQEITDRLGRMGVRAGGRIAAGTLHSWCLTRILRPYGPLVKVAPPGTGEIVDDGSDDWADLLQHCLDETTAGDVVKYVKTEVVKIRRRLAAGLEQDERDPLARAARLFDQRLLERGWYDFDLMVSESLALLRREPRVTGLVASRFPLLIVDEYQDLGPVLHALVTHLHDHGKVDIVAFGDPDQTIMRFTGADPAFLVSLAGRADFRDATLNVNYRCGSAIITVSHAAIEGIRDHAADPSRDDPGVVELVTVTGAEDEHAQITVAKIDELVRAGVAAHQIAVFYPRKSWLLDALLAALDRSDHEYIHENDRRLPDGDVVDFVRACAARAVAGPRPIGYPEIDQATAVSTIGQLTGAYRRMNESFGAPRPLRRVAARKIATAVSEVSSEAGLTEWLDALDDALALSTLTAGSPQRRDQQAMAELKRAAMRNNLTVGDIAGALRVGKITLTTYHSAKGREWDYVILPGLVDGILPSRRWSRQRREWLPAAPTEYDQSRSLFYVGLTRARRAVILIEGSWWHGSTGIPNHSVPSPFVSAVRQHTRPVQPNVVNSAWQASARP